MGRIRVLDATLANQIAAGEVVERPASVAKELLENALDAGATAITVEIDHGGVERLRVVDNGHGMSAEDATLALRRHATSKLRQASDLHHIQTLGFRGEALPSIASVSRFSIRSREPEAIGAVRLEVEGGSEPRVAEAPGPVGTEMLVRDLFYNVPARRKFLKKPATEASHVQEAVTRLALVRPEVAFRFVRDGRTVLDLPRHTNLADRVRGIFGPDLAAGLAPVAIEGAFGLDGLLGPPDRARATSRHYYLFINGRHVRDRVMMGAIQAAYRERTGAGRHPFVVLRLTMPPEAVDVNVHPAKTEVRFVDSGAIHRMVFRAVAEVVRGDPWAAPEPDAPPKRRYTLDPVEAAPLTSPDALAAATMNEQRRRVFDALERIRGGRGGGPSGPGPAGRGAPPASVGGRAQGPARPPSEAPRPQPQPRATSWSAQQVTVELPLPTPESPRRPALADAARSWARLEVVGETSDRALLLEAADGLVVLDVEAARRRLLYDRLLEQLGQSGRALASPATFTMTGAERAVLEAHAAALREVGVDAEPFGGETVALKALPEGVAVPEDPRGLLAALLEVVRGHIAEGGGSPAESLCLDLARRARIAGPVERRVLLSDLDRARHPCPIPFWRPLARAALSPTESAGG